MDYKIVRNTTDSLEIEIKRLSRYNYAFIIGILTAIILGTFIKVFYTVIEAPYKLTETVLIFLLLLLMGSLFGLKLFFWNIRGKEKVIITPDLLIIRKQGTLFSVPRKYELSLVEGFSSTKDSPYPWWMRIYGLAGGQVMFHYLGSPRYFGQTLSFQEAQQVADIIVEKIIHQTAQPDF